MSARRSIRRRDWPRGLYETRPGYYVWRHPDPKHVPFQFVIGRVDLQFAKDESIDANNRVSSNRPSLGDRVMGSAGTMATLVGKMPVSTKPNTVKTTKAQDKHILAGLGADTSVTAVRLKDCADVLTPLVDAGQLRQAQAVRSRMVALFRKAMALGWVEKNPAAATETPRVEVQRGRLLLPQFRAIYDHPDAPPFLRKAMMLLLITGQDRGVASMHADMLTQRPNPATGLVTDYLIFQRAKTERTNQPVAIPLDITLAALGVSLRSVVEGETGFFVHHDANQHQARPGDPVHVNRITRAFTDIRRAVGIPDTLPDGKDAPTFYEVKSLGKRLYKAQGNVDTMHLFSHTAETDALYADPRGAEPVFVAWTPPAISAIDAAGK